MNEFDRRRFLKTAAALLPVAALGGLRIAAAAPLRAAALAGISHAAGAFPPAAPPVPGDPSDPGNLHTRSDRHPVLSPAAPLLSFSTLGCPDWTFAAIVDFAAANGYDGIELRGIQRQLELGLCPAFSNPANILASRRLMEEKGLRFVDLGSSAELHHADAPTRKKNLDEVRRFIDLAQQLHCPYIRVFPNNLPKDQDRDATIDLIIQGLLDSAKYAEGSDVTVLMESHGDLCQTKDLERIMRSAAHPHTGLVWDIINMWSVTKEPPAAVYPKLKDYIRHAHIKDLRYVDGKERYTLMGKGESPIFEGIDALANGGYKGYYSFEWEKLWHPEIEEPAIALADYPGAMKRHFKDRSIQK